MVREVVLLVSYPMNWICALCVHIILLAIKANFGLRLIFLTMVLGGFKPIVEYFIPVSRVWLPYDQMSIVISNGVVTRHLVPVFSLLGGVVSQVHANYV